jgi:hypothetical protein
MWEVDQDWLPGIRDLCRRLEPQKKVTRLSSLEAIDSFTAGESDLNPSTSVPKPRD